jgi:predicted SAM-dependent methyltransferase
MKINYINIGCGSKYHKDWVNIDMASHSREVISHNLLEGIPFPDESFEVVYHSQVLEHFPKEKAPDFIKECFRILKKDGVIRIVVPDLENIVNEYKKYLLKNLEGPDNESEANYDWIMLEMFDQMVRNKSGGQMAEFLKQENMVNEKFVIERIGFVGRSIRNDYLSKKKSLPVFKDMGMILKLKKLIGPLKNILLRFISSKESNSSQYKLGRFRLSGEIHMWMYDRYSLARLLDNAGFKDVKVKDPFNSDIPNWNLYELDVKDGLAFDPMSLFIEARS